MAIPVSISIYPNSIAQGGSVRMIVTLGQAPIGSTEHVPVEYVQLPIDPNDAGKLLVGPPSTIPVHDGQLSGYRTLDTAGGTSGGSVVVIAGTGLGAVASTLTIT